MKIGKVIGANLLGIGLLFALMFVFAYFVPLLRSFGLSLVTTIGVVLVALIVFIAFPLRYMLYYRKKLPQVGLGALILDDIIYSGTIFLPLVMIILLAASLAPELRQTALPAFNVCVVLYIIDVNVAQRRRNFMTETYKNWCKNFVETQAESVGVSSNVPNTLYGVLISFGEEKNLKSGAKTYAISIAMYSNGWTSVHSSLGASITHPDALANISQVSEGIIEHAHTLIKKTRKVRGIQIPPVGYMTFYFLTTSGLRALKLPRRRLDYTELPLTSYMAKQAIQIRDHVESMLYREDGSLNEPHIVKPIVQEKGHPLEHP